MSSDIPEEIKQKLVAAGEAAGRAAAAMNIEDAKNALVETAAAYASVTESAPAPAADKEAPEGAAEGVEENQENSPGLSDDNADTQTTEKQKDFRKKSAEVAAMPDGSEKDAAQAELDELTGGKKKKRRGGKSQRVWKKNKKGGRQTKKRRNMRR